MAYGADSRYVHNMKPLRYLAIVLAAIPGWGGVRIKLDRTDLKTNAVTHEELLLDADRFRTNMNTAAGGNSVLFLTDGGRNRIVMLDNSRNEYREMDQQTMNQVAQQLQGAMSQLQAQLQNLPPEQRAQVEAMMRGRGFPGRAAASAPEKTTYTATGSGSVNGFACTNYVGMRGTEKVAELCASKPAELKLTAADFQVFDKVKDFMAGMLAGLTNSPFAASLKPMQWADQGIDGFPVAGTSFSGGQATDKTEVKSIERANFSDADFSLGSAKKVDLMPSGRGRGR
jgi:hypothetical protein